MLAFNSLFSKPFRFQIKMLSGRRAQNGAGKHAGIQVRIIVAQVPRTFAEVNITMPLRWNWNYMTQYERILFL